MLTAMLQTRATSLHSPFDLPDGEITGVGVGSREATVTILFNLPS